MKNIFKILGRDPESEITVDEFVTSYVKLEQNIRMKNIKIEKEINELSSRINTYTDYLSSSTFYENEDENGLTDNSYLYVWLIAAKNLTCNKLIGGCNPYAEVSFDGKVFRSLFKKNTVRPVWNEEFKFKVKRLNCSLTIEIFDDGLFGRTSLGYFKIGLIIIQMII